MILFVQKPGESAAALIAAFLFVSAAITPVKAAQQTVDAFATWQGDGKVIETGENHGTFVGAIAGPLFVQSDKGPLPVGQLTCPALVEINLLDGKQNGAGKCTIKADDGAMIFADWSCKGVHLVGCDGEMTLTGGTGRFAGVTGSGAITVRSTFRGLASTSSSDGTVQEFGGGVIVFPGFTYNLKEDQ